MSIVNEAPRGGLIETINDRQCVLLLRNGEIERFEDKHRGIFDVWAGFFEAGKKPTSTEVRDLIALGLGWRRHEALGSGQDRGQRNTG